MDNVLIGAGREGDYVVIDLEMAGPLGAPWLGPLGKPSPYLFATSLSGYQHAGQNAPHPMPARLSPP